jgi:hypothetical protein
MAKIGAMSWRRIGGWIVRLILALAIAFEVQIWLDILVFQPEEYERLIGSESACGVVDSYCSWRAFILDNAPIAALAVLSILALLWRRLPRRELVLFVLAVAVCSYLGSRAHMAHIEIAMTEHHRRTLEQDDVHVDYGWQVSESSQEIGGA